MQRRTFFLLFVTGLVYFTLFCYPNSYGAGSYDILGESSGDEYVVYPNLLRMLTPGRSFYETRANLLFSDDYHYGYPFYAVSALVLLPVRLIYGLDFAQPIQLNLLLLRQWISVLPMILAAGILVYLQTRFRSPVRALLLFVFLLTIRGVVRNHIWWWHPDALAVLAVVLTIFLLDRDRLRFGRNFYLAALACGMATAIKLLGVFFFLTIPAYLLAGLITRRITLPRSALAAGIFVAIMAATVVFSNPFLFSDQQRARMLDIQAEKRYELSHGYEHDDPLYYSKGPRWWISTIEKWYGSPLFLGFLFVSLVAGSLWGGQRFVNRLILTWVVPYSIYLLYFVAVKPDHYWLPVMLPLFSSAFALIDLFSPGGRLAERLATPEWARQLIVAMVVLLLVGQFILHLGRDVSGNLAIYRASIERGVEQLER